MTLSAPAGTLDAIRAHESSIADAVLATSLELVEADTTTVTIA